MLSGTGKLTCQTGTFAGTIDESTFSPTKLSAAFNIAAESAGVSMKLVLIAACGGCMRRRIVNGSRMA
jgi:hypothetical protein